MSKKSLLLVVALVAVALAYKYSVGE